MTTINERKYGRLLATASPRKIETEEQNERYLGIVEKMIDKGAEKFSPEEHVLFDLLVTLIEDYEDRTSRCPILRRTSDFNTCSKKRK